MDLAKLPLKYYFVIRLIQPLCISYLIYFTLLNTLSNFQTKFLRSRDENFQTKFLQSVGVSQLREEMIALFKSHKIQSKRVL